MNVSPLVPHHGSSQRRYEEILGTVGRVEGAACLNEQVSLSTAEESKRSRRSSENFRGGALDAEAQILLNQLQSRQEQSTSWFSHCVTAIKRFVFPSSVKTSHLFDNKQITERERAQDTADTSTHLLLRRIAKTAYDFLQNQPDGATPARKLIRATIKNEGWKPQEKVFWVLLSEVYILLKAERVEEAKAFIFQISKAHNEEAAADLLADLAHKRVFQRMELRDHPGDLERVLAMSESCFKVLSPGIQKPRDRIRLYRFLLDRDDKFPKLSAPQQLARTHFLLRMGKSNPAFVKEFSGQKPMDGISMLVEDINAYLEKHPDCPLAVKAKHELLHCRSWTIQADSCVRLAWSDSRRIYLDIYYEDLQKEIHAMQGDDELLLLGGPFDHAMLHNIRQEAETLKTYNTGLGRNHHLKKGETGCKTHIISKLTKKHFGTKLLSDLLAFKLVDCSSKSEAQKGAISRLQVTEIYKTLRVLASQGALIDSKDQHHAKKSCNQNDCLRGVYLLWLKENIFKEKYADFKATFSEKALQSTQDPELLDIGCAKLEKRRKKQTPAEPS